MQPIDPSRARKLVLIELNEVNFEVARLYVDSLGLTNFKALLDGPQTRTSSCGPRRPSRAPG